MGPRDVRHKVYLVVEGLMYFPEVWTVANYGFLQKDARTEAQALYEDM